MASEAFARGLLDTIMIEVLDIINHDKHDGNVRNASEM